MDPKYIKAVEGRKDKKIDSKEIFRKLSINDSDPFSKEKLLAIETTVAALNAGDDIKTAAKKGLDAAANQLKTNGGELTVAEQNGLASPVESPIPVELEEVIDAPIDEAGKQTAWDEVAKLPDTVQRGQQSFSEGVERYIINGVCKSAIEEMKTEEWQKAAIEAIRKGKQ